MRLTTKKITDILVIILGEDGIPLIKNLIGKENVSEFDLAKRARKDIKVVRKMLYLLYNHNLVAFTRKKDKQKGWYIYYWTLLPDSIRFSYFKMRRDLLNKLEQQLSGEQEELFFVCPSDCVRMNFDQAMEFEFHCPECGKLLNQDDSESKIKELKKKIGEVKKELEKLQSQRKARRKIVKERKEKVQKKKVVKRKKAPFKKKKVVKKKKASKKKSVKKKVSKKKTKKAPSKKKAVKNKKPAKKKRIKKKK